MMKRFIFAAVLISTLVSCGGNNEQGKTIIHSQGLKFCEGSVPYGSTLLISNFGTEELNPLNSEGKGYIAQLDGETIKTFIAPDGNLSAPKGMAIKGDYLYIADVAKVVIYNLSKKSSAPIVVDMPEGDLFVNDIAISGNTAYISVTNSGKLYTLDISSPEQINSSNLEFYADVVGANGIAIDGKSIYVASYPADGNTTESNVIYKIEDMSTPVASKFIEREGQYDGLAISDNKLYFTSWINGELGYVNIDDRKVVIQSFGKDMQFAGPADISLLGDALYLPDLPNSRIVKIEL